ncbi:protocatechuate 3,4-dioxygenase subunit alpha [Roseiterribacter gracilis]|uniref:Protocatechuate 3,4-dioxygenase subunit alpha n=1 Tax=Roseiterribacter gracilis TaxID=2812848 RepID=A0A8S8XI82_9PROT|nr:protocatechuate 3,4-dioxygenase subunit alpha [Rhodospirillales bacterium TMPK1]
MTIKYGATPSQTVGPFFHYALPYANGETLADAQTQGTRIEITGRVLDADGEPVPDAMIEIWQANHAGRYAHAEDSRSEFALDPHFTGFGRTATDATGTFRFTTVRPGRVPGPGNSLQAPHIAIGLFGRGLLNRLVTRLYFADAAENADDPILALVPERRRSTLLAQRLPGEAATYRLDLRLGGNDETVFFAL